MGSKQWNQDVNGGAGADLSNRSTRLFLDSLYQLCVILLVAHSGIWETLSAITGCIWKRTGKGDEELPLLMYILQSKEHEAVYRAASQLPLHK